MNTWIKAALVAAIVSSPFTASANAPTESASESVDIRDSSRADPYREPDGTVHYEASVLGQQVCVSVAEPDPRNPFDQGTTLVGACGDPAH